MSTRTSRTAFTARMMAVAAFLAACGGDGITPPPSAIPVASVAVSPPAHSLIVGQQVTLQAKPKAADGRDLERNVSWSSENEQRATVSPAGIVTTLGVGEVGIRAVSEGKVGRALLTITAEPPVPVAEVRLSVDDEIVLEWDGRTAITATALDANGNVLTGRHVQWSSNRPHIAAVDGGTIEAVNPGIATISAVVEGVVASVGVRVNVAPVTAVFVEALTTGLEVAETFVFWSRVERANGEIMYEPAAWSSSDPAVARVEHVDLWYAAIAAQAEGQVTITATREGVSASLTVRVTARPTHDLVYNRWLDNASEIFTLGLGAPGLAPVRINAGNVSRAPSPSPDGTQLVFAVSQTLPSGEAQHDLYIVNRDGTNMRWLTRAPGMEDHPRWSPDGSRILFQGTVDGRTDLFTVDTSGTNLTNLTGSLSGTITLPQGPAWSPDGSRIAFIGVSGSQHKVWTIDANGGNATQITTDAGFDMHPTFSHDGTKIAFVRYNAAAPGFGDDIMIVSSLGGTPERLALPGDQRQPAWSPDGSYIAVSGHTTTGHGASEIYTMRPDGTGLRLRTVNPGWGGGLNPAWIRRP